jgi:hypothetical protein
MTDHLTTGNELTTERSGAASAGSAGPVEEPEHSRRGLLALFGVLGAATLAACSSEVSPERDKISRAASELTGVAVFWVDTYASLRAHTYPPNEVVVLLGYYTPGDGGGGVFVYDGTNTVVEDHGTQLVVGTGTVPAAGTVGQGWRRLYDGPLNVKWFGATGSGAGNESVAFTDGLNALSALGGGTLFIPKGTYRFTAYLTCPGNVKIVGAGMGATILLDAHAGPFTADPYGLLTFVAKENVEICSLTIKRDTTVTPATGVGFQGVRFNGTSSSTPVRNIHVHDVECVNIVGENFYAQGWMENVRFTHNRAITPGAGLLGRAGNAFNLNTGLHNAKGCAIIGNYAQGGYAYNAILVGGNGVIVAHNHITDWGPAGAEVIVIAAAEGFVCTDNVIENCSFTVATVSAILVGFSFGANNEQTSGRVAHNIIRNCTFAVDSQYRIAAIYVCRVIGPVVVASNQISNCHPSTTGPKPAAIQVSSDGQYAPDVTIEFNYLNFGTGNPLVGVRVASGVPTTNGIHVGPNEFSTSWATADRYEFVVQPNSRGIRFDHGFVFGADKPTVSGARNNPEAALKDLLSKLAAIGLIADTTTAT